MTQRILLADDSATIRKVVELTFSDEDYAIDSVGDGALAFEHAQATRPDIIISDVAMPGLNGYELCQRFKTDPDLRSVPFLFLKGTFESFDEDKARSCGADGFIVKPFESQEMIAKVKDLIGMAAAAPAAPTPIPTMQTRPAPAPPAIPSLSSRPELPIPQWPTHPAPDAPILAPPPLQPTSPIRQHPTPVPPPPIQQAPPPPPPPAQAAAVPVPVDDFGFDFGEAEDDRFGALAAQPLVPKGTAPPLDSSGESDEDLWSEVSLRGNNGDLLEGRGHADSEAGPAADIVDLMEEAALIAPEVLFEDEAVFEELSAVRSMPLETPVAPPAAREESPVAAAPEPASSLAPAAPISIDQLEIERIVSSRVEAAVRQILEPIVGDLARTMIESVAWEVIPDLAEAMIRAEIERVRQATRTD